MLKITRLLAATASTTAVFMTGHAAQAQNLPSAAAPSPNSSGQAEAGVPAASVAETTNDEIVVTAQKRAENLQDVAASISAVSGDALRDQQITSIEGLAQSLANVNFGQTTGNAKIAIRGVGFDNISLGNEGRVAYHTDGVYVSRPAAALATFYDVARVEVLRGPQGTLYGRNATGGAVNVISNGPSQNVDGYIEATLGNYALRKLEGGVGGPLSSTLSARLSFQVVERDGYGTNITNGLDIDDQSTRAIRAQLLFEPSSAFEVRLIGDYFKQDDHAYGLHYLGVGSRPDPSSNPPLPGIVPRGLLMGGVVPQDLRDSAADTGPFNNREYWGLAALTRVSLGGAELNSITSYRSSYFKTVTDLDATSAPVTVYDQFERAKQFSQELRLSGEYARGDWLVGVYYFHEGFFGGTRVVLDPALIGPVRPRVGLRQGFYGLGDLETEAYAAFANVRFRLTDQFALRLGARYSDETKKIDEANLIDLVTPYPPFLPALPFPAGARRQQTSASWSSFNPSATLEYKPNDDILFYATYSRGFKSGGFNVGNVQPAFAPETITDYEVGFRGDFLNGLLRTNLSAFAYDYSNLQVSKVAGTVITIENAASAKVYGLEAEILLRPSPRLRLETNFALLNSKYGNYVSADPARPSLGQIDLSGNELSQAPRYSINAAATYTVPTTVGKISLRGDARWVGKTYFSQFNLDHIAQPSYSLYNAFITWTSQSGELSSSLFVRNIANKDVLSSGFVGTTLVGAPFVGSFEPPRTFGVTVGYHF